MFDRGPFRALATLLFAVTLPGTLIAQPTKQVGTIGGSFDVPSPERRPTQFRSD
jgi:hypothetical protein